MQTLYGARAAPNQSNVQNNSAKQSIEKQQHWKTVQVAKNSAKPKHSDVRSRKKLTLVCNQMTHLEYKRVTNSEKKSHKCTMTKWRYVGTIKRNAHPLAQQNSFFIFIILSYYFYHYYRLPRRQRMFKLMACAFRTHTSFCNTRKKILVGSNNNKSGNESTSDNTTTRIHCPHTLTYTLQQTAFPLSQEAIFPLDRHCVLHFHDCVFPPRQIFWKEISWDDQSGVWRHSCGFSRGEKRGEMPGLSSITLVTQAISSVVHFECRRPFLGANPIFVWTHALRCNNTCKDCLGINILPSFFALLALRWNQLCSQHLSWMANTGMVGGSIESGVNNLTDNVIWLSCRLFCSTWQSSQYGDEERWQCVGHG